MDKQMDKFPTFSLPPVISCLIGPVANYSGSGGGMVMLLAGNMQLTDY